MIMEADAVMAEENNDDAIEEAVESVRGEDHGQEEDDAQADQVNSDAENEDDLDVMDEDSSDDSEDADTSDDNDDDDDSEEEDEESSEEEEEYAWGDHVGSRSAFHFNADDTSESDEESDNDTERDERARRISIMRARRNILSFLRSH